MTEPVRLSKRLIELIHCSRNEAEQYIEGGWVLVDGEVVDEPQFMVQEQQVELHPDAVLAPVEPMTILLHLPTAFDLSDPTAPLQLITPATRAANDSSGVRTLKRHFARLMPTMPLEAGATGFLVFTQDKRVVKRLVEDAEKNEQEYHVEVSGAIEEGGLDRLNRSMKFNGWPLPPAKVSWQNENRLRFALKNVRAGQIEFMCKSVGLTVVAMKRIRIGRVPMSLQPGQWRYLPSGMLF
jgi:23S rRNA pseudouridine2604 synthase